MIAEQKRINSYVVALVTALLGSKLNKLMKNKTIIHRFEAVVYPYRIWVAFTDNIKSLNDNLMEYPSEKPFVIPIDKKLGGFTTMAVDKEGYIG